MNRSKSGLFLMELIIAIAFFAFSSSNCIQLFAKAHTLSAKSAGVNMAIATAQSAAECFKSTGGNPEEMSMLLGATAAGSLLTAQYDEGWQAVSGDGRYVLTVELDTASSPASAAIVVIDNTNNEVLHQLVAKKYIG